MKNNVSITPKELHIIANTTVLFIGETSTVIAKCASELGFKTITITDSEITDITNSSFVKNVSVAVNTLGFSNKSKIFNRICKEHNIVVVHPFNLGWGALFFVVLPNGMPLTSVFTFKKEDKQKLLQYVNGYLQFWNIPKEWINTLAQQKNEEAKHQILPKQLTTTNWMIASKCTYLLFALATQKHVKIFPDFYLTHLSE